MEQLEISDEDKADLISRVETALLENVAPAYQEFISRITAIGETVEGNYGLAGPNGDERVDYYDELLRSYTTTDLSADEIHEIGLSEVARIQEEMRAIMAQVNFDGDLQDFFDFMRTDEQFYKSNTEEGRQEYLELARGYIANIEPKLDELFITKPKAPVEVRRVEPFREPRSRQGLL